MTFSPRSITIALKDKLLAKGYNANIGDPPSPPQQGLSVYITYLEIGDEVAVLDAIDASIVYAVRFYWNITSGPTEEIELQMGDAPFQFWFDIMNDFDLGVSGVRNINVPITPAQWDVEDVMDQKYLTFTLRLGVTVNNLIASLAA